MAAQYRVDFSDGTSEYVCSADAKASTVRARRTAYTKARKKGEEKRAKKTPGGKPTTHAVNVQCVG